jgi:hypothetical protein
MRARHPDDKVIAVYPLANEAVPELRMMDYATTDPRPHRHPPHRTGRQPIDCRDVDTDGVARAAQLIAELLSR